jgi:histone demethylase JARID1
MSLTTPSTPTRTPDPIESSKQTPRATPSRRGRRSGARAPSSATRGSSIHQPRQECTFVSSLSIPAPGAIPRPPSPFGEPIPSSLEATNASSGAAESSKRAPRKSKMEAIAALATRSVSPSGAVGSQPDSNPLLHTHDQRPLVASRRAEANGFSGAISVAEELDMASVKIPGAVPNVEARPVPRLFELEDCPVFHPSAEEFKDPMSFIRSISDEARNYGICKVVPPKDWRMPFITDTKVRLSPDFVYCICWLSY